MKFSAKSNYLFLKKTFSVQHGCKWVRTDSYRGISKKCFRKQIKKNRTRKLWVKPWTSQLGGVILYCTKWSLEIKKALKILCLSDKIYQIISSGILKFTAAGPFGPHTFLHRINTSGLKIRPVLKKFMIFIS